MRERECMVSVSGKSSNSEAGVALAARACDQTEAIVSPRAEIFSLC